MSEQIQPSDNGMCMVLNLNNDEVLTERAEKIDVFKAAKAFMPNKASKNEYIVGTGVRRGLLLELLGPRHRQNIGKALSTKQFMVRIHLCMVNAC